MKKLLCLLPFLSVLLHPFETRTVASPFSSEAKQGGADSVNNEDLILSLDNSNKYFDSSTFDLSFTIQGGASTTFEETGCSILNLSRSRGKLIAKIHVSENRSFLIVKATAGSLSTIKKIYFYRNTLGQIYFSLLSSDSARKSSGVCPTSLYSGINGPIGGGIIIGPIQRAKTFGCDFFWKDSHGTEFPLVGARVNIKTQSGKSITKATDDSGLAYFNFVKDDAFVGGGKEYLSSIWSEIENNQYVLSVSLSSGLIRRADSKKTEYSAVLPNQLVTGKNAKSISFCFEPSGNGKSDSDFGQAIQIFQALHYYSQHANSLVKKEGSITLCNVEFPANSSGSCYDNETIYIGNDPENNISGNAYESWDAIGHEYGHHLEHLFKISNSKGGKHTINRDNSSQIKCDPSSYAIKRDYNLRLAWAEAWATIWAAIAQKSFPEAIRKESYLSVGDDQYTASNFDYDDSGKVFYYSYNPLKTASNEIDYNHQIMEGNAGDGCELSIERFLYQLFDSDNDEIDKYSISEKDLWDFVVNLATDYKLDAEYKEQNEEAEKDRYRLNYFYQYLSALESKYGFNDIASLAECYNLCPSHSYLKYEEGNYKVFWKINLPASGFSCYRYNKFQLKLYKSKEDKFPIILSGTKPISPKTDADKVHYYFILDSDSVSKIKSAGNQAYLSIESYYYPPSKGAFEYLGPVEGPKSLIQLQ